MALLSRLVKSTVKRVGFYPSCSGNEPHFGHLACLLANWLFARQNKTELLVIAEKGHSVPVYTVKHWIERMKLLGLPNLKIETVLKIYADEHYYRSVERAIATKGVKFNVRMCPIHPGEAHFCLSHPDINNQAFPDVAVLTMANAKSTDLKPRDFPSIAGSASLIVRKKWGVTHMIRGSDLRDHVEGQTGKAFRKLIPDECEPSVVTYYIPIFQNHLGQKLSGSQETGQCYELTSLLDKYGRNALLAVLFSALQPWKMRWREDEIFSAGQLLNWMVKNFDLDEIPDPNVPIKVLDLDPAQYGRQMGLLQRIVFE